MSSGDSARPRLTTSALRSATVAELRNATSGTYETAESVGSLIFLVMSLNASFPTSDPLTTIRLTDKSSTKHSSNSSSPSPFASKSRSRLPGVTPRAERERCSLPANVSPGFPLSYLRSLQSAASRPWSLAKCSTTSLRVSVFLMHTSSILLCPSLPKKCTFRSTASCFICHAFLSSSHSLSFSSTPSLKSSGTGVSSSTPDLTNTSMYTFRPCPFRALSTSEPAIAVVIESLHLNHILPPKPSGALVLL
mmetsp:Transcript_3593/g.7596  ORF Transcript_3593/g.7596 Transcript_3593/m.7596 type:complete len:250 (-) Transcript_3593:807-1556(-)